MALILGDHIKNMYYLSVPLDVIVVQSAVHPSLYVSQALQNIKYIYLYGEHNKNRTQTQPYTFSIKVLLNFYNCCLMSTL